MHIRKTTEADLPAVEEVFRNGRRIMRENGNPTQWGDDKPTLDQVRYDMSKDGSYVIEDDNGKIVGTFAFILGDDPAYARLDEGEWLNDEYYGTIHHIAAGEGAKGIFSTALEFCEAIHDNIRIDTHPNNHIMQHNCEKHGFVRCGMITVSDGSPRITYQKKL